jgi:hypothetical protein
MSDFTVCVKPYCDNAAQAEEVRRSEARTNDIAAQFGISRNQVWRIKKGLQHIVATT